MQVVRWRRAGLLLEPGQPTGVVEAFDHELVAHRTSMQRVALEQTLGEQLSQVAFAGERFRRCEDRIMQATKLELQPALLGDFERVARGLGNLGEERFHLFLRAQVELLLLVTHPVRRLERGLRAQADQAIVRVRVLLLHVMHVVGADQLDAELARPGNQMLVHVHLLGDAVVLELEVIVVRPERLLEPVDGVARLLELALGDQRRHLAGETTGERDEAVLVRGKEFLVDARLVVHALEMGGGDQLDEILVADLILREQDEVMILVAAAGVFLGLLFEARTGGHVNFAADDGLDACIHRGLVELDRAEEHAVIGDGQGGEAQFAGALHEPVEAAGTVEQRELRVEMEMDEFGVAGHRE